MQTPQTSARISAIILAAGASTRMGTSKQMLDIEGEHLLTRTIKAVAAAGIDDIVVVLGARKDVHQTVLKNHKVTAVTNERWESGIGSSIKKGLECVTTASGETEAAIIFTCDQPMLTSDIISKILWTYKTTGKDIVASGYSNSVGIPVLFARSRFPELSEIPDDQGAKKIIMQHTPDMVVVPFPGGEIDLDTMEDYERFIKDIRK